MRPLRFLLLASTALAARSAAEPAAQTPEVTVIAVPRGAAVVIDAP